MSDAILRLENVTKHYRSNTAVDHVTFDVPRGSIFGLLGPNGAGKTSLIRIITTITRADEGVVYLDGEKLNSTTPEQIGYMPEERGLYKKMKVGDHLMYLAQLKGMSKSDAKAAIREWMIKFEITDWWDKKVESLSKGMQQKIQFIATVIHRPKLLILDEPFSGLDPVNTNLIKDEIYQLNEQGTSIIFSTHRMEQVEQICEEIVLINKGQVILQGKVRSIKDSYKLNRFFVEYLEGLPADFATRFTVIKQTRDSVSVQLHEGDDSNDLLRYLVTNNVQVRTFKEILPTLNEIFIREVSVPEEAVATAV